MKILLLPILSAACILPVTDQFTAIEKPVTTCHAICNKNNNETSQINFQDESGYGRMSAVVFKNQDYCRAELKDFEFDAKFIVVSATVYFSGTNFKTVQKASITSNSLKPIKNFMDRCSPGSIVVFDDVKVKGPDNETRTIPGISLTLY